MKNQLFRYLSITLIAMLMCNMAQAQKAIVKLNPLSLIFATGIFGSAVSAWETGTSEPNIPALASYPNIGFI